MTKNALPPIDAHVQWNGAAWGNYTTKQPKLPCQFEDHRTCKELSKRLTADRDGALEQQRREASQAEKDKVAQLAAEKLEQEKKDLLAAAAQLRAEATNEAVWQREAAEKAAREAAAARISKAQAALEAELAAANAELEQLLGAAAAAFAQAQQEISAADWQDAAGTKLAAEAAKEPAKGPVGLVERVKQLFGVGKPSEPPTGNQGGQGGQ